MNKIFGPLESEKNIWSESGSDPAAVLQQRPYGRNTFPKSEPDDGWCEVWKLKGGFARRVSA